MTVQQQPRVAQQEFVQEVRAMLHAIGRKYSKYDDTELVDK